MVAQMNSVGCPGEFLVAAQMNSGASLGGLLAAQLNARGFPGEFWWLRK